MCTIEVDGMTYADKKEGDTFSTGWGEIKIISINVSAQTVTIMHGDQTLTLHVGERADEVTRRATSACAGGRAARARDATGRPKGRPVAFPAASAALPVPRQVYIVAAWTDSAG